MIEHLNIQQPLQVQLQIISSAIDLVLSNRILLYGIVLLAVAIGLEILNGFIEIAAYTLGVGGLLLLAYGGYVVIF